MPEVELYYAKNLTELRERAALDSKFQSKKPENLVNSAQKLMNSAIEESKKKQVDEEKVYMYLFRSMELWHIIMNSNMVKEDKTYFTLMHGKNLETNMVLLETYSKKLETRYRDLKEKKADIKHNLNDEFKLDVSLNISRKKNVKDPTQVMNGTNTDIYNASNAENNVLGRIPTSADSSPENRHQYYEKKFMSCDELKKQYPPGFQEILIIDIRPSADFQSSKISNVTCINIPETQLKSGLSANKLGGLISDPRQKIDWDHRDQFSQVVLLDWNSEEKDVIPNSYLSNLYVTLTKWDPQTTYKNRPLILAGGFERWLDMYPTLTTNPKIQGPPKTSTNTFIHLSEQNIDYPMSDLDDFLTPVIKPVTPPPTNVVPKSVTLPTVDRSTKPDIVSKKTDKQVEPMDTREVNDNGDPGESPKVLPTEKTPEINQELPKTVNTPAVTNLKTTEKLVIDKPHRPVPQRPATPPREEKRIHSNPRKPQEQGEGDGSMSFEKLKLDAPRSGEGGLKRSFSSPNINKIVNDESGLGSHSGTPAFNRNTKPKTSTYDTYGSPRHATEDTINYSSHNHKGKGLTGLKNLGNLCYMNSIMQCMSNTEQLTLKLTAFDPKDSGSRRQVLSEVGQLLRTLWQGDSRITSCRNLKAKVGALEPRFSTTEQQDSHEFLTLLMDWLHEDLKETPIPRNLDGALESTGEKAWGEFQKKNNSTILDLFYGQQKSTITCNSCHKQSILFEPFWHLSIPLPPPQDSPSDSDRRCTVQECLKLYLKGESISGWNCPNCKAPREATKKLDITRLPPVLIIHLKRFMNVMAGVSWCRKRINMVDFPINDFDMRPFTHPDSELRFHNYNLYAVSNHYGSMEGGHYTAYCKNHMQNKWYKFDDQDVSEMSPSDVKSIAAYILFYESDRAERSHRTMD